MKFSAHPPNMAVMKAAAIPFFIRILDAPGLGGVDLPSGIKGYIYIDDTPRQILPGHWMLDESAVYLARSGRTLETFTKLGILAAVASLTGAIEEPTILEKFSTRLVQAIQETTSSVYGALLRVEATRPTRLAIDQVNARVAAELNGGWHLASGSPVEVDDTWIIMAF